MSWQHALAVDLAAGVLLLVLIMFWVKIYAEAAQTRMHAWVDQHNARVAVLKEDQLSEIVDDETRAVVSDTELPGMWEKADTDGD